MFTVVKVRRDQKPRDYSDPGWYAQPEGTHGLRADRCWACRFARARSLPRRTNRETPQTMTVRKPASHGGH